MRAAGGFLSPASLLTSAALLACIAIGFVLRLEPSLAPARRGGEIEFDGDAAFHYRMLEAVVATGQLPAIDPLGLPPMGKPIRALLPSLLHHSTAAWHRLLTRLGLRCDLSCSAIVFAATCGALVPIPVVFAARALGLGAGASCLAAASALVLASHAHGTAGAPVYTDAPLGALLVLSHLAALAAALAASRGRGLIVPSTIAAVFLALAMAAWRPALALVGLESFAVLGAFLTRRLRLPLVVAFAPSLGSALAASLAVPYLLSGPFLLSRTGALAFLTLGLLLLDAATALHAQRGRAAWVVRAAMVALVLATSFGLGRAPAYDNLGRALATNLGASHFSAMGPLTLLLILFLVFSLGRRHTNRERDSPTHARSARSVAAYACWHGATITFCLLSLIQARYRAIAAPLVGLYPAMIADDALRTSPRRAFRLAVLILSLAALVWTGAQARQMVRNHPPRLDPELRAALGWLTANALPGDIVYCDWTRGDVIQSMAGVPAVVDRMVELPEIRQRIVDLATALFAQDDAELVALCHRHRARYLWINAENLRGQATLAGLRGADYFAGMKPTARGEQTTAGRLLLRPQEVRGLEPRFAAGAEHIFEVTP